MRRKLSPLLSVGKSRIQGKGCFARVKFRKGQKIEEYTGERITQREAVRRARGKRTLRICAIDSCWSIDGSRGGNGTHYINHSCAPNCYMRIVYGHILFFALCDISPGDEITLDYVTTYHSDQKRCHCNASTCRGTINRPERKR